MGKSDHKKDDDSDLADPHLAAITEEYEMLECIGTGHFAKVRKGRHKQTGELVAVKIITKPAPHKMKMLKAEVDIMTKLDHPNVVRLHKVVDTETKLYLVMELLTGGELFDRIVAKGHYSEADARTLTRTIVNTMAYLHSQGVAHRDLKPENVLLATAAEDAAIKITDFGLSRLIEDSSLMTTACGTPGYVAPEVITHEAYSTQIDMWSVGVIVYILLCGFPPFYGENDAQMFRKIRAAQYKFLSPYWDSISAEAKDFVSKLLVVDPQARMTAKAALQHKWLVGSNVSTRNLFGGGDGGLEAQFGDASIADEGVPESRRGSIAAVQPGGVPHGDAADKAVGEVDPSAGKRTMQQIFREYNLDRKVSGQEQLMRVFKLPADSKIVEKYQCGLENKPGRLYLTSYHLCFIAMSGHKYAVPLSDVKQLIKAKRFRFSPGHGHSIHAVTLDGKTWQFTGIIHRDEALMTILKQCYAVDVQPEVLDVGSQGGGSTAGSSRRSSRADGPGAGGGGGPTPTASTGPSQVSVTVSGTTTPANGSTPR